MLYDSNSTYAWSLCLSPPVLPEVSMSADPHPNVLPGQSVTISCVVTRGDPSYVTYTWTFHNQVGEVTALADQTSNTLVVANVQVEHYGTYYCTATNNAGRATTGMIIGEGGAYCITAT